MADYVYDVWEVLSLCCYVATDYGPGYMAF